MAFVEIIINWGDTTLLLQGTIIVIIFVVVAIATVLFLPRYLVKRAISQVIRIMQNAGAMSPATAKTREELKLQQKSIFQKMGRRDYKPFALEALIQKGIVLTTRDDRIYLSETDLLDSSLKY